MLAFGVFIISLLITLAKSGNVCEFRNEYFYTESPIFQKCDKSANTLNFINCGFGFTDNFGRPGITSLYIQGYSRSNVIPSIQNFVDLEKVYIQSNYVKKYNNALNNKKLTHFECDNCKDLQQIDDNFFRNLTNLESLDLSSNSISNISKSAFSGNPNLKTINLSGNNLRALDLPIFENNSNLKVLNLYSNQITTIDNHFFCYNNILEEINLGYNNIKIITQYTLKCLRKLISLDLSNNRIFALSEEAFTQLPLLETLNLKGNKISVITKLHFANLPSLKYLSLKKNEINTVEISNAQVLELDLSENQISNINLNSLSKLESLELQNNSISRIDNKLFENSTNLVNINLMGNKITTIDDYAFRRQGKLKTLNLAGNSYGPFIAENAFYRLNNTNLESITLSEYNLRVNNNAFDPVEPKKIIFV